MDSFSDNLKALRKLKNCTQKQIATLLGVNERTYRRYESGELEPNHQSTIKLADYFEVSTDYLLGRSEDPTRH